MRVRIPSGAVIFLLVLVLLYLSLSLERIAAFVAYPQSDRLQVQVHRHGALGVSGVVQRLVASEKPFDIMII